MSPNMAVQSTTRMIQQILSAIQFISQPQEFPVRADANFTM
jgi:hypothetical protein